MWSNIGGSHSTRDMPWRQWGAKTFICFLTPFGKEVFSDRWSYHHALFLWLQSQSKRAVQQRMRISETSSRRKHFVFLCPPSPSCVLSHIITWLETGSLRRQSKFNDSKSIHLVLEDCVLKIYGEKFQILFSSFPGGSQRGHLPWSGERLQQNQIFIMLCSQHQTSVPNLKSCCPNNRQVFQVVRVIPQT